MDKKQKREKKTAKEAVKAYVSRDNLQCDPNGSWTGCPENKNEVPTQDADDL